MGPELLLRLGGREGVGEELFIGKILVRGVWEFVGGREGERKVTFHRQILSARSLGVRGKEEGTFSQTEFYREQSWGSWDGGQ